MDGRLQACQCSSVGPLSGWLAKTNQVAKLQRTSSGILFLLFTKYLDKGYNEKYDFINSLNPLSYYLLFFLFPDIAYL